MSITATQDYLERVSHATRRKLFRFLRNSSQPPQFWKDCVAIMASPNEQGQVLSERVQFCALRSGLWNIAQETSTILLRAVIDVAGDARVVTLSLDAIRCSDECAAKIASRNGISVVDAAAIAPVVAEAILSVEPPMVISVDGVEYRLQRIV